MSLKEKKKLGLKQLHITLKQKIMNIWEYTNQKKKCGSDVLLTLQFCLLFFFKKFIFSLIKYVFIFI